MQLGNIIHDSKLNSSNHLAIIYWLSLVYSALKSEYNFLLGGWIWVKKVIVYTHK